MQNQMKTRMDASKRKKIVYGQQFSPENGPFMECLIANSKIEACKRRGTWVYRTASTIYRYRFCYLYRNVSDCSVSRDALICGLCLGITFWKNTMIFFFLNAPI